MVWASLSFSVRASGLENKATEYLKQRGDEDHSGRGLERRIWRVEWELDAVGSLGGYVDHGSFENLDVKFLEAAKRGGPIGLIPAVHPASCTNACSRGGNAVSTA